MPAILRGGGGACSQIKTKWKRLNQSVSLLEFGLRVLGVSSGLHVTRIKGVVGLYRLSSYSLYGPLFYSKIKAS